MTPLNSRPTEADVTRVLRDRMTRFREKLEHLTTELLQPFAVSGGEAPGAGEMPGFLPDAVRGLATAGDQIALLDRLLEGTAACFSRSCLFIVRGDVAHGWSSVGFPETEEGDPAKGLVISLGDTPILGRAANTRQPVREDRAEGDADFLPAPRPGDRIPRRALAAPLVIQDTLAAILYADDGGDGHQAFDFASAEILASVAALAASLLALRSHPEAMEWEGGTGVEVRVPPAEEGGGLVTGPAAATVESLDEEFLLDSPEPGPESGPLGDLSPEETRAHEDARRFARLLVSELLLYNEDLVIQGRKHRDIYQRLREDIDRSRQTYEQRVPAVVATRADYFTEELIRTLAGGDPTALGPELAR